MAGRCITPNGNVPWDLSQGCLEGFVDRKGAAETYITTHNVYPEVPTIDARTWKKVRDYYVRNAPSKLPKPTVTRLTVSRTFKAVRPAFSLQPPSTTFVNIDDKTGSVTIGDAVSGNVFSLTPQLSVIRRDSTGEAPAWITSNDEARIATIMGSFSPTDAPTGKVVWIPSDPQRSISEVITDCNAPSTMLLQTSMRMAKMISLSVNSESGRVDFLGGNAEEGRI
ncbi:MAG: hypothetical protein IPM83_15645 [Ignavibacteria bacterium]|nr:hypothetical protein [Ignavibacteria bacterium]